MWKELVTRLLQNPRSSFDGLVLAVIAAMFYSGLSAESKSRLAGLAALLVAAIGKLLSTDPGSGGSDNA